MEIYQEVNKELGTNYKSNKEIDWNILSYKISLPERFIEKYQDKLNWGYISQYQTLSENFIEKFQNKVDWGWISGFQKLSEPFIEKHSSKLDWWSLSFIQVLSEEFIIKWITKINIKRVVGYQKLSKEFIEKFNISPLDLKNNILFQPNSNRDWFIAYISSEDILKENNINGYYFSDKNNFEEECIKVRIYYKDLKFTIKTYKFEKIRKISRYKIYGRKER